MSHGYPYIIKKNRSTGRGTPDYSGQKPHRLPQSRQALFDGFCDGFYYRPRIDKAQLEKHHEGLIISSACLGGEIDQKIMAGDLEGAEKAALWYKNLFGEDYYLEVMRHPAADPKQRAEIYDNQQRCIQEKIKIARKLNIKLIATNDVHFLNEEEPKPMIC